MITRTALLLTLVSIVLAAACSRPSTREAPLTPAARAGTATQNLQTIDPISPRRDFTGPAPDHFEWTPVKGADRYAIGIFNEVDLMMWRRDDVPTNSVPWPAGLRLDAGTYFWAVTALQGERAIGDSGRTALVVTQ